MGWPALDSAWPHWLGDGESLGDGEARSSWFLSRDAERPAGCRDPALRRCHRDSECADGFEGAKLVCLLNFADPEEQRRGICAREGSCYQHRHCDFNNTNKMCTGAGECVEPRVLVSNDASYAVEFQLFGAQCTVDTRRLSRYEAIPDFARAHGMCSFRDWSVKEGSSSRRAVPRKKCVATTLHVLLLLAAILIEI